MKTKYIVAITGASGVVLGIRLVKELLNSSAVHLIISDNAIPIINDETPVRFSKPLNLSCEKFFNSKNLFVHAEDDMYAPVASGSYLTSGMFVVPCSMKTMAALACGFSSNLIHRAVDVTIKEGRKLIIAPREMPFSAIHLENMLKLARLGVTIAPPVAAFYTRPRTIENMIDFVVGKILDSMGVRHNLYKRWQQDSLNLEE